MEKRFYTGKDAIYLATLDQVLEFAHNPQPSLFPQPNEEMAREAILSQLDSGQRLKIPMHPRELYLK